MGESENEYGQQLIEVIKKIHCMKRRSKGFGNLSQMECMVLFYLGKSKEKDPDNSLGVKVSTITNDMDIPKPATSKILNSLEEMGYIERKIDRSDRRVTYISLTEEGLDHIESMRRQRDQFINDLMNKLGHHDAKELIRIIDKLYQIVTNKVE